MADAATILEITAEYLNALNQEQWGLEPKPAVKDIEARFDNALRDYVRSID